MPLARGATPGSRCKDVWRKQYSGFRGKVRGSDSLILNLNFAPRQKSYKMLMISVIINIGQNQEIFALRLMVIYANTKLQDLIFARFEEKLDRKFQCDTECRLFFHPIFLLNA